MKFSHANAYSFGKSQKCTLDKTDPLYTPGPGQYQPGILKRSEPKWKIGTAKRGEGKEKKGRDKEIKRRGKERSNGRGEKGKRKRKTI